MAATLRYRVPAVHPDLVVMGIIINDFDTSRTPGVDAWGYNTHGGASDLINRYPRDEISPAQAASELPDQRCLIAHPAATKDRSRIEAREQIWEKLSGYIGENYLSKACPRPR